MGVSRPDPWFRTLTSSGARRVARGRGARRRTSRARTGGIGRGRPRRTEEPASPRQGLDSRTWSVPALGLGARAVVGQRRLQPRHERRLQAGRVEAPGLQLLTQLRYGHLRDRHLPHRSVGWRSRFSTRARVCPGGAPHSPEAPREPLLRLVSPSCTHHIYYFHPREFLPSVRYFYSHRKAVPDWDLIL